MRDAFGLPAYCFTLDQFADPLGSWDTRLEHPDALNGNGAQDGRRPLVRLGGEETTNRSQLHWHQVGNDRVTAVATDDGWTQLYSHEDGPRWINMYRPELRSYAGGVSFVSVAGELVSTLYRERGPQAQVDRVWGCGYSRFAISDHGIRIERTVFAPFGDSPFLVALVTLRNDGEEERELRHLEYWDLHIHTLDYTGPEPWHFDTERRDRLSSVLYDDYECGWDDQLAALVARHPWRKIAAPERTWPGAMQRSRPDVSLVPLGVEPVATITDRRALFADGDPYHPSWFTGAEVDGEDCSPCPLLAVESVHSLAPGEEATFGFAYGATPGPETAEEIARARAVPPAALLDTTTEAWRDVLPSAALHDPDVEREVIWSAYYVRSGAAHHRGFGARTLPQGGAYQYLGGLNAGPRATLQHALPLIWCAPELAKDAIRFTLAETHPSGEIPYAEAANGMLENVRYLPSDHDLWLLWAVSDYVLGRRDRQFLGEVVSYWPAPYTRAEPVWDHCLRAFRHLLDDIGYGPHGLLRMRSSDWNDSIVREGSVPIDRVWDEGESTLNSAMAVHVLRRFAELASYAGHPDTQTEAGAHAARLADALRSCWRGRHLNRGWRSADAEVGYDDLFLEPQPWALIAEVLEPEQRKTLVEEIDSRLADPLGSRIFDAGRDEGNLATAGGGTWLSINSTLVWGLSKVDVERAWSELKANSLHNHAETYPDVWSGIWSGPDTYNAASSERPGETWSWSGVFGMQAWPVQILFAHSELLNGVIWMLGIEGRAGGLSITPRVPFPTWSWRSRTLSIDYGESVIELSYRAAGCEQVPVEVALPAAWHGGTVTVGEGSAERKAAVVDRRVRALLQAGEGRCARLRIARP